jgi:hypothetical protein
MRARANKASEALRLAFNEVLQTVNTSIPGHVLKFDPSTQLAEIQVGIKRVNKNGEQTAITPIIEVMVNFSGGVTYRVEHEVNTGDEGILIFSQRCIDSWNDQGGVVTNPILRFHDMQDAYFIPGIRSQKNKLTDFENDGIRITDGTNYFWLKKNGDLKMKGVNVDIESDTLTHNGTNIGDDHHHAPGTYNIGGTPVVDLSGDPQ